jgi:hypothetical protein
MARYQSPKEYLDEASSPNTTSERLDILSETEWEFVRAAVAANPNTSTQTLVGLLPRGARQVDESIAIAIARRSDATPYALRQVAERFGKTRDRSGRSVGFELGLALLSNPSTPEDVIARLLDPTQSSAHFRTRVASINERPEVLAILKKDVNEKVRQRAERS